MRRTFALLVSLSLAACDRKAPEESAKVEPAAPVASTPTSTATALVGAITLPKAIPSDAFVVAVVRMPEPLLGQLARFDPFPGAAEDLAALRGELDEITRTRLGLTLTDVKAATVFALDDDALGAVIDGAAGEPKGKPIANGIVALEGAGDVHAAMVDGQLVVGSPDAVAASVAAGGDAAKQLASRPEIAGWLASNTDGAALAIAVDGARAPANLKGQLAGVERAFAVLAASRFAIALEGEPAAMQKLSGMLTAALATGVAEMDKLKSSALAGQDTFAAVGAVLGAYQSKRLQKSLTPVIDGRFLKLELPFVGGDGVYVVALVGVLAAIAIPAFTKYMRRSKTSEARVQIAKLFDSAAAYFNEEHTGMPATHVCPNDGRDKGQSGITPPLSVDCNAGPGGRCVPVQGEAERGPGQYDAKLWTDNKVWAALGIAQEQAHYFHYNFIWDHRGSTGFGMCQFTAQAFGDLDGDGVFSTFERSGAADELGVNAAAGLYIDQEVE
ncbi:MAG TPA: hypothetical protein VG755_15310 [Nannocystaceae bacterium]|nr:hypothetical protein [Nannocystaceae bacterium]